MKKIQNMLMAILMIFSVSACTNDEDPEKNAPTLFSYCQGKTVAEIEEYLLSLGFKEQNQGDGYSNGQMTIKIGSNTDGSAIEMEGIQFFTKKDISDAFLEWEEDIMKSYDISKFEYRATLDTQTDKEMEFLDGQSVTMRKELRNAVKQYGVEELEMTLKRGATELVSIEIRHEDGDNRYRMEAEQLLEK